MCDKIQLFSVLLVAITMTTTASGSYVGGKFHSQGGHFTCVRIPNDLKLCHGVGYSDMVLPNLLRHETLVEAKQQAASFVPLLRHGCHSHARVFLCSLFAPVCLLPQVAGAIPPCKQLCSDVERSCAPLLREYQFDWPSMLNCSQFTDEQPCVNLNNTVSQLPTSPPTQTSMPGVCAPCRTMGKVKVETLNDNFCASEFVVKVKSKKLTWSPELGIRELTASPKRRIVYKKGPLDARDLRRMRLVISGKGCKCSLLIGDASWGKVNKKRKNKKRIPRGAPEGSKKKRVNKKNKDKKRRKRKRYTYLIMGRKDSRGSRLLVTEIYKWTKKNKALKAAAANKFNQKDCPSFNPVMQHGGY